MFLFLFLLTYSLLHQDPFLVFPSVLLYIVMLFLHVYFLCLCGKSYLIVAFLLSLMLFVILLYSLVGFFLTFLVVCYYSFFHLCLLLVCMFNCMLWLSYLTIPLFTLFFSPIGLVFCSKLGLHIYNGFGCVRIIWLLCILYLHLIFLGFVYICYFALFSLLFLLIILQILHFSVVLLQVIYILVYTCILIVSSFAVFPILWITFHYLIS